MLETCKCFEVDPDRPLMLQVLRFDCLKDPLGVIAACRLARTFVPGPQRTFVPGPQLVLAELKRAAAGVDDLKVPLPPTPTPPSMPCSGRRTVSCNSRCAKVSV